MHDISSSEPSNVATLNEIQVANHVGISNLNRALSTSPVELSSPPLPAITPPLSQNVHTRTSQDAGNIPFGPPKAAEPGERDRSPSRVDSLSEMKPLDQQVDRTASVQPFPIPAHSVPPLKRRGISISSSISRAASVLTMIAPSRKGTAREELPVEPHVLSGRAPSELSHPRDEDKGKAYTNKQRPPSPRGRATSIAESPSLPLPVFGPHLWDEIYSSIRGNEGVDREINGTAPMQQQPNHATRVPSNDDLTSPNAHTPPQPPTVVSDSQARAVLCPSLAVRSDGSLLGEKGETRPDISPSTEIPLMLITTQPTPQERPSVHPRSSPLGDGHTELEQPGQSGGDRKPGDGQTEDERIREARPESPSQSNHGSQGCFKDLYRRAWKKYPCCYCIFHALSYCLYLCSCGPCCD